MYAEKINTDLYLFSSVVYVTSIFDVVKENLQVKLYLDESNFNFGLVRSDLKDIRFSELPNGDLALNYWVAEFFPARKIATIWIRIPSIKPGETKPIFVFFGNVYDKGNSTPHSLGLHFLYIFNQSQLDTSIWSGSVSNSYDSNYGYPITGSTITTKNNPFSGLDSWEIFVGFSCWLVTTSNGYGVNVVLVGGENPITFVLDSTRVQADLVTTGSTITFSYLGCGTEENSYGEFYSYYNEYDDSSGWALSKRDTLPDCSEQRERNVEGNTASFNLRISRSDSAVFRFYLRWIIIKELTSNKIVINTDELYKDDTTIADSALFSSIGYSSDLTYEELYHESNCGGEPKKLSDNFSTIYADCWYSSTGFSEGSVIIDFVRTGENLVNNSYKHYDSTHEPFYGAVKLSDDSADVFGRHYWLGKTSTGWACVDFSTNLSKVSSFGLKALSTNTDGMVKDFIFQGGYGDPRKSSSPWVTLYEGTCQQVTGWQQFYFINENKYRYYRLVVESTYGSNICLEEWNMYEADVSNINGYAVNQLRLLPATFDSNENYFPRKIKFYGSNNLVNWVDILQETTTYRPYNKNVFGFWQRYSLQNERIYRAYKLEMYENWGGSNDRFVIAEWEMVRDLKEDRTHRVLCNVPRADSVVLGVVWSIYFDGINDYISFGSIYAVGTTSFTVEVMIYIDEFNSPAGWGTILTNVNGTGNNRFLLQARDNGVLSVYTQTTSTSANNVTFYTTEGSYKEKTWHRVSFVRSGGTGYIYVDGELKGQGSVMSGNIGGTGAWVFGGRTSSPNYLNFFAYGLRVWNIALSQSYIYENKNNVLVGNETGLFAYYKMDEGGSTVVYDSAGTKNGTINGGAKWVHRDYYYVNSNISQVWASKNTTFENGWCYLSVEDVVMKLYDYKLSECVEAPTTVSGILNDIILLE